MQSHASSPKEKVCLLVYIDEQKNRPWVLKKEESLKYFMEQHVLNASLSPNCQGYQFVFFEMPLILDEGSEENLADIATYLAPLSEKNTLSAIIFIKKDGYVLSPKNIKSMRYIATLFDDYAFSNFILVQTGIRFTEEARLARGNVGTDKQEKELEEMMHKIDPRYGSCNFLMDLSIQSLTDIDALQESKQLHSKEIKALKEEFNRQTKIANILLEYTCRLPDIDISGHLITRPSAMKTSDCFDSMKEIIYSLPDAKDENSAFSQWISNTKLTGNKEYTQLKSFIEHLYTIEKLTYHCSYLETWLASHNNTTLMPLRSIFLFPPERIEYYSLTPSVPLCFPNSYAIVMNHLPNPRAQIELRDCSGGKYFKYKYTSEEMEWDYGNLTILAHRKDRYEESINKNLTLLDFYKASLNLEKKKKFQFSLKSKVSIPAVFLQELQREIFIFHHHNNNKVSLHYIEQYYYKYCKSLSLLKMVKPSDMEQSVEKVKKKKKKKKPSQAQKVALPLKIAPEKKNQDHEEEGSQQYALAKKSNNIKQTILYYESAFSAWACIKNKKTELKRTMVFASLDLSECYVEASDFSKAKKESQRAMNLLDSNNIFSVDEAEAIKKRYELLNGLFPKEKPIDLPEIEAVALKKQDVSSKNEKENLIEKNLEDEEERTLSQAERIKIVQAREEKRREKKLKQEQEKQDFLLSEQRYKSLLEYQKKEEEQKEEEQKQFFAELNKKSFLTRVISGNKIKELAHLENHLKNHCDAEVTIGGSLIARLAVLIFASEKATIEINDVDFFVESKQAPEHCYEFKLEDNIKKSTLSKELINHGFQLNKRLNTKSNLYANYTKDSPIKDINDKEFKVELAVHYPGYEPLDNLVPFTEQRMRFSDTRSDTHLSIPIGKRYLILVDKKDGFIEKCRQGLFWLNRLPDPFSNNVTGYFDRLYGAYSKIAGILKICELTKKALSQEWQVSYFARQLFLNINAHAGILEIVQLLRKGRFHNKAFRQSIKSFCMAKLLHSLYHDAFPKDLFTRPEKEIMDFLAAFCKEKKLEEEAEKMVNELLTRCHFPCDQLTTSAIMTKFKSQLEHVLHNIINEPKDSVKNWGPGLFAGQPPDEIAPQKNPIFNQNSSAIRLDMKQGS